MSRMIKMGNRTVAGFFHSLVPPFPYQTMLRATAIQSLRFGQDTFFRGAAAVAPGLAIGIASRPCGFFGNFFITLNGLCFCDRIGAVGVPMWDRDCLYLDGHESENIWDTFFFPPEREGDRNSPSPMLPRYFATAASMTPYKAATPRLAAHSLMRRFAEPHRRFVDECDQYVRAEFGKQPTIGVQVRGTDARRGLEARATIAHEIIDAEIADRLRQAPDSVIFIATDEVSSLEKFQDRYGDRVRYRECLRSMDGKSIHGHYDAGVRASGFDKARDVLLDALILARCDFLIRTHSAVTTYSLCRNPSLAYVDLEKKHLNIVRQPWLHEGG
jgi:hypothetical protein